MKKKILIAAGAAFAIMVGVASLDARAQSSDGLLGHAANNGIPQANSRESELAVRTHNPTGPVKILTTESGVRTAVPIVAVNHESESSAGGKK